MKTDTLKDAENAGAADYKEIQRECEAKAKRAFFLKGEILQPGSIFSDLAGRRYIIAPDGSHRRVKE